MSLVPDCSATLAWIYPDEVSAPGRKLLGHVASNGAVVPPLWRVEVANSLTVSIRRGRVSAAFRTQILNELPQLDIAVDTGCDAALWSATVALADRFRLTVYDATCLELALRTGLPLGTFDMELRAAATSSGVALFDVA